MENNIYLGFEITVAKVKKVLYQLLCWSPVVIIPYISHGLLKLKGWDAYIFSICSAAIIYFGFLVIWCWDREQYVRRRQLLKYLKHCQLGRTMLIYPCGFGWIVGNYWLCFCLQDKRVRLFAGHRPDQKLVVEFWWLDWWNLWQVRRILIKKIKMTRKFKCVYNGRF